MCVQVCKGKCVCMPVYVYLCVSMWKPEDINIFNNNHNAKNINIDIG